MVAVFFGVNDLLWIESFFLDAAASRFYEKITAWISLDAILFECDVNDISGLDCIWTIEGPCHL